VCLDLAASILGYEGLVGFPQIIIIIIIIIIITGYEGLVGFPQMYHIHVHDAEPPPISRRHTAAVCQEWRLVQKPKLQAV
jgi:hypothetical protein